jgi:hypothetical protein
MVWLQKSRFPNDDDNDSITINFKIVLSFNHHKLVDSVIGEGAELCDYQEKS